MDGKSANVNSRTIFCSLIDNLINYRWTEIIIPK